MPQCREMRFTGMVQGIGFRWTAKRIAEVLGLSGWVRNNSDGSVSLAALGEDSDIAELVERLDAAFGPYIQGVENRDANAEMAGRGFHIR